MAEIIGNILKTQAGSSYEYALYSDAGGREVNEDFCTAQNGSFLTGFFLCDGLGGHGLGDLASQHVTGIFAEDIREAENVDNFLPQTFERAQQSLLAEQERLHAKQRMKTTAVALVTDGRKLLAGHVGDSRLYYFRRGKIKCRTLDHSVPQMMVLAKEIKEEEIRNHPSRSLLIRVMGTPWEEPKYELMKPARAGKYDAFLLCSDGFWELITEKEMEDCYKKASSTEEWLRLMKEIVFRNGANVNMDNNTAIAVRLIK